MKNITIVSYFIRRAIEKYSEIASVDEYVSVALDVLSEQLITKQNSAELIFLVYKYPQYVEALVDERNIGIDDYEDTAICLYRRILSGASQFDIAMSDIFPTRRDAWYAPWCDGLLATRPILQKDICTFFCPDSTVVGPYQLALANQYGNVVPTEVYDFDFDCCIDLDDDANYEDCPTEESDDDSAVSLREYCADMGIMYEDAIPCAAAQVVDVVDDALYNNLADELKPLIDVFKNRAAFVASCMNVYIHDHVFYKDVNKTKWQLMFDVTLGMIMEDEDMRAFHSPLAKLYFTLYPIFSAHKESVEYKMHLCHSLMLAYTTERAIIGTVVSTDWSYYGHYPRTLLNYFSGELTLDSFQDSIRKEFSLIGPKSYVVLDEDSLVTRDAEGMLVASNSPFLPLVVHWTEMYPVFVRAKKASQFLARKLLMERDYPHINYVLKPPNDIVACADFSMKSSSYACLFVGGVGYGFDGDGYIRCKDQAAVCMGFALKAVLARGLYTWPEHGKDPDDDGCLRGSNEYEIVRDGLIKRLTKGARKRNEGVKDDPPVVKRRDRSLTVSKVLDDMFSDIEDSPPPRRTGVSMDDEMIVAMANLLRTFDSKDDV